MKHHLMENQAKKRTLSLSLKKTSKEGNCSHFASPTKPDDLTKGAEGIIPVNTKQSTNQVLHALLSGIEQGNERMKEQIETDISSSDDQERLWYTLRLLVMEAQKVDGEKYPLSSHNTQFISQLKQRAVKE